MTPDLIPRVLAALGLALDLIQDPVRRSAEWAVALSEMVDGNVPTIVKELIS